MHRMEGKRGRMGNQNRVGSSLAWFIFGSVLGASVAILLAPQSGEDTRQQLSKHAARRRKNLVGTGHEVFERGRELFERGREIAQEASEMFERGRRLAEKSFEERS
jgi:gas vesicle protein